MSDELVGLPSLKEYSERAFQLKDEYLALKDVFEAKQKEYNSFFQKELPKVLDELGVESLTLKDGTRIMLKQKGSLSLTTEEKQEKVYEFLEKHGGSMLLSEKLYVDPLYKDQLTVPFVCQRSGNTNTIKAFLMNGVKEGLFDIPEQFPLYIWKECEVK